jgi:hypothetical protein
MKKISIILSAFALIICSCTKEQPISLLNISPDDDVASFTATFEGQGPETKLGINTSTGVLSWANEDAIAVQMTDNTFVDFVYNSSDQKFYASLGGKTVKDGGVAYYPASIALDGNPDSVDLPTSYSASVSAGVARVCPPMKATVDLGAGALSLEHLGGILSVNVSHVPADADKLVLTVPQKTVTGTFTVDTDHISAGSKSSTVTINFENGILDSSAKEFYIPVPVTTFTGGFTVDFKNASDQTLYTHSTEKTSIEVGRAKIKRMENLTVPISIYVRNNNTDWTTFMAYYYSATYTTTSFSTNELDGASSFTHGTNSGYLRFTLPESEIGKTGNIIFHDSEYDAMGRVQIKNITFNNDKYYTVSGDGTHRIYIHDELNWANPTLFIEHSNGYQYKGGWPGASSDGSVNLFLEANNGDSYYYWEGTDSWDSIKYIFVKNGAGEQTADAWYGRSGKPVSSDLVLRAYWNGSACVTEATGWGKVATYTED